MRRITSFYTLCFVLLATILTGCHSNKPANKDNISGLTTSTVTDTGILFSQLVESYNDWTVAYMPITLSLDDKNGMSISGRATMVYDKEIYISLRMLGMEVAQAYADNNEVYIVDKFHKVYLHENLSKLVDKYGLTIRDLQDLLLGKAAVPGQGTVTMASRSDFEFLSADGQWIMSPKKQFKNADWNYMLTMTEPPVLSVMSLRIQGYGAVELCYSQPTQTPSGMSAAELYVTAKGNDRTFRTTLSYDLNSAEWNTDRTVNFKKPSSSYRQLTMVELLRTLGSM